VARKTPPVAKQVVGPKLASNAFLKARLIDFDTGGSQLEEQHKAKLREMILIAGTNSMYRIRVVGFASKVGDAAFNSNLSFARMTAVMKFLESIDPKAGGRVETFRAVGEEGYQAAESDNSADFRAVEVHIFIGDIPPSPVPPNVKPTPKPPLPGGPRSGKWEVAAPGGATFTVGPSLGPLTAGVTAGVNFFLVRNKHTGETRNYAALALGPGVSLGIPGVPFKSLKNLLQTLLTGPNFSGVSFTDVFPPHAVTFEEVESCLVTVEGVNAGVAVLSGSAAVITFHCPGVFVHGPSGTPIKVAEDIWSFNSSGRNFQLGAGGSAVTGPLIRL
jgi:hypothetical protein